MIKQRVKSDDELMLRGLAIVAVVGVHFLASLPSEVYTALPYQPVAVFFDQLSRISVPLFVALSGYGLGLKYLKNTFAWGEFLRKRVFSLLPLYVLWSVIFYVVFWFIPEWRPANTPSSFLVQLLLGKADYHLYFVPMIFQLYLLFPLMNNLVKRYSLPFLILTGVFQLGLFAFYSGLSSEQLASGLFSSDQQQYVFSLSWIFYFALGIYLAQHQDKITLKRILVGGSLVVALSGLVWAALVGMYQINHGIDPIVALRFTRWPVLVYASAATVFLLLYPRWFTPLPKKIQKILALGGRHSYSIYLGHTLFLRAFFQLVKR